MNKTVTINISGIIFHIEEDAYEKLSKYLSTIKGYFSKTDGGSEIMSDIEARIAEMLQSKTSPIKQVVLMNDVDSVMEAMGKPEEFAGDQEQGTSNENTQTNSQTESSSEPMKKRLFRDPDHKAIGGVCSGIAAYFDVDLVWIRLAMFLLIFFGGLSLWVYIILWIVIPEAKTTAEKLAMKGERIDINNISKTVKEEAEQLKNRAKKYGQDFKNSDGPRNFFDKLGDFIKEFLIIFGKFFGRVIGLILLIFGIGFMIILMGGVFGFSIISTNIQYNEWIDILFLERNHYLMGLIGVILFFGVPILMMIYGGIKLLFKIHYSSRWLNISAGLIWLVGFMVVLFVGFKTFNDCSESSKVKESIQLLSQKDTLYLTLNKNKELITALQLNDILEEDYDTEGNLKRKYGHQSDYIIAKKDGQKIIVGYASLNILPSSSDKFELYVVKKARGEDKRSAVERAKSIQYKITQTDSLISFDELFMTNPDEKFRVQDIEVILKVPRGKVVHLDKSLEHFIYDVENVTNTFDGDMVGRRWIMSADGLRCVDCNGLDIDEEDKGLPLPPPPPGAPINVNTKDGSVNIDKDGIKINAQDAKVHIDKNGVHINTKETKEDKK